MKLLVFREGRLCELFKIWSFFLAEKPDMAVRPSDRSPMDLGLLELLMTSVFFGRTIEMSIMGGVGESSCLNHE